MFAGNVHRLHLPPDDAPHTAWPQGAKREPHRQEHVPAGTSGAAPLQILQDRFAHFILNRVLLDAASLGAAHREDFRAPVKIIQPKTRNLAAAEAIDGIQENHRPRAIPSASCR